MGALLVLFFSSIVWFLALRGAHIALIAFIWSSTMFPDRLVYGSLPVRWAMIYILTMLVGLTFGNKKYRMPRDMSLTLLFSLWLWTAITTLCAEFRVLAIDTFLDFSITILTAIMIPILLTDRRRIEAALLVIVLSFGFYGTKGGLWTMATGGSGTVLGPPATYLAGENEIARAFVFVTPLMYYFVRNSATRFIRITIGAAAILTVIAILGTNSRGGMLSAFVSFSILALLTINIRRLAPVAFALVALTVASYTLIPQDRISRVSERLSTVEDYNSDESFDSRKLSWAFAMQVATERPLVGGGFEIFRANRIRAGGEWQAAHSNYFQILAEQGYVGLAVYLLLGCIMIARLCWLIQVTRKVPGLSWACDLAKSTISIAVGYYFGGIVINQGYYFPFYAMLGITAALTRVVGSTVNSSEQNNDRPPSGALGPRKSHAGA